MTLPENISSKVLKHIANKYSERIGYASSILSAVNIILKSSAEKYNLPRKIKNTLPYDVSNDDDFQNELSKINEKEDRRKKEGVFYTDRDVTDFIVSNAFLHYIYPLENKTYSHSSAIQRIIKASPDKLHKLLNASIIDPTCGAGEFLLSAIAIKILICSKLNIGSLESICSTIYGNDIEQRSTDITKLRLFFYLIDNTVEELDVVSVANHLNRSFTNVDAVNYDKKTFKTKDIIIGNPPYVEYRNFDGTTCFDYGNVYADVLHNSVDTLSQNGIMSFVIPLSYVSTIRMNKIRAYLKNNTDKQIVLNFADRPDSLFSCVHQKLTILFAQKGTNVNKVYSSSYNYWYTEERTKLFCNILTKAIDVSNVSYWPKIGNEIEQRLYNSFLKKEGLGINDFHTKTETKDLYINQRGCFWMKIFSKNIASNSYARYGVPKEYHSFAYCLLNSSLFFLMWIIVSDGWHITNKELNFIKFPKHISSPEIWDNLKSQLEQELEDTKEYVGTKQVEYEYKHKKCKNTIDRIDYELAKTYGLSDKELTYIINFGLKYRMGDGA